MGHEYSPVPAVHTSTNLSEPPSYINGLEQISAVIGNEHNIHYASPKSDTWQCLITGAKYEEVGFGSAMLIKKKLSVIISGYARIAFYSANANDRVLQYVVYDKNGIRYLVAHLHGVWLRDNTKGDDPIRDLQSSLVLENLFRVKHNYRVDKIVFGGDLNLALDTRALRQFEYDDAGEPLFRNVIREQGITNTRTPRYRKFHVHDEAMHADYAFVSPNVEVAEFSVENHIEASDHAPLHLIFR